MTEQRGRPVSLYGQTVAMATIMEELSERDELLTLGGGGAAGKDDETGTLAALQAEAAEAEQRKLPRLLLAPGEVPGLSMLAPETPPNAFFPVDEDYYGTRIAEIPDWIGATFALEARWGNLEKLEEAASERKRLSEEWAPPAELRDRLLLGDPALLVGVPDGRPGGCGYGEVDPLMKLMEGVLPGVDDSEFEFGEEENGEGGGAEEEI